MILMGLLMLVTLPMLLPAKKIPPHIILIYADDLGWNDVSFHGSPEIPTPNIDALGLSGITLHNYYGEWLCTPSRGALLTGKYPIRLGLQHKAILVAEASGLPLELVILPQHLKKLGYSTHMVGKWHLGYQTKNYTPTYRGFDTFFGYYNSLIQYYDYTLIGDTSLPNTPYFLGIDIHDNIGQKLNDLRGFRSKYATYAFTDRATDIIAAHNTSQPLFLYLAHLAVHAGLKSEKIGLSPPHLLKQFSYIKNFNRRVHAARVAALDDSVGTVMTALHNAGMLSNSIVIFVSDNGGELNANKGGFSSNYPLRGSKHTLWEGGYRIPGLIFSPLLKLKERRVSRQWMHVTDWLPTLYSAAGGKLDDLGEIDGHNLWKAITRNSPSPRSDMLYNIDPIYGASAFRDGHLKVINGTIPDEYHSWYGPTGFEHLDRPQSMFDWVFKNGSPVRDLLLKTGSWMGENADAWYSRNTVVCQDKQNIMACDPVVKPCLFNITQDPCEYHDLANDLPQEVHRLMTKIHEYEKVSVKPQSKPSDPHGNPLCYDFAYVPWMDSDKGNMCDF